MKYKPAKRIIAIALSVISAFCVPLTLSATAATVLAYPVIYVPDMTEMVIYENPNSLNYKKVYDANSTEFLGAATDIFSGLAAAAVTGGIDKGVKKVNDGVKAMLGNIACDAHGNSKNPLLGTRSYYSYSSYYSAEKDAEVYNENLVALINYAKTQGYGEQHFFFFTYDWRLDPLGEADRLEKYIDKILINEGAEKVRLVSGGFGGIIVNSYLSEHETHAQSHLASCVFLDTMMTGNSIIGDIMTGHIVYTVKDSLTESDSLFNVDSIFDLVGVIKDAKGVLDGEDVGVALARYLKQDPLGIVSNIYKSFLGDSLKTDFLAWLTLTIGFDIVADEGMFNEVGKGYKEMLLKAKDSLYSGDLAKLLGTMPGVWAMVPEEEYEEAIKFMFGSREEADSQLIEKLDNYRTKVAEKTEDTLQNYVFIKHIPIAIVAGYAMQILPVTAHVNEQSDGFVATRYAGVGATTGDLNKDVTPRNKCANGKHNHIEPGRALDASTCFLPENTWFIKGHSHMDYTAPTAAEFIFWLLTANEGNPRHIFTDALRYPQYLQKARLGNKIYAYSVPSENEIRNLSYGDLNIDGKVSSADARLALRYAVGLESDASFELILITDVNKSGKIDAADARLILRYSVGLESKLPVT